MKTTECDVPHKVVVLVCGMRPLLTLKELGCFLAFAAFSDFRGVSHRPPREFMALILYSLALKLRTLIDWKARS